MPHVSGKVGRRKKRSRIQRARDWAETERLAMQGFSQSQIAAELSSQRPYSLSRQQIAYDLAQLAKQWREAAGETRAAATARQLRRLELTGVEAWQAFEKSKKDGTPNPQWLRVLCELHDRIVRLLALESPARTEISGPNGGAIVLAAESSGLTPEAKASILRRHLERLDDDTRPKIVEMDEPNTPEAA